MFGTLKLFGKINTILIFAAVVTLSLFYSMQLLIMMDEAIPEKGPIYKFENVTIPDWEPDPIRKPNKPEEIEAPPKLPSDEIKVIADGPPIQQLWNKNVIDTPVQFQKDNLLGPMDGNAMPIAQIQPRYPDNAAQRGIEGFVIVEFDVSETGSVLNPRVLGAEPLRVFDRAALRAIQRWKYNPKVLNGRPIKMMNLRTRFSFNLKE